MYNPLCIDALHLSSGGRIGMAACPGRGRLFGAADIADNRLERDLAAIRAWGATALLSLMEREELEFFAIETIGTQTQHLGMAWYHLPIADFQAPGPAFEQRWETCGPIVRARLRRGERIMIHCLAGLGRTGTVAARILIEFGSTPRDAITHVRAARPHAIQSPEQEFYLLERHWLGINPFQLPIPAG
ncbi:cyclin-dependent kinase inhibitor 3 family protein [Nitrococcus mobilis]|uniref:Putative dual use protein Tyr:Ser/Thr phosphatase n=1 Tax=Nitrococcus mobilis Nb-231 TaxID=314278 RepID=A4BVP4_9GAMM|nr:cyclin-dependent kinase inhibitor 3 family protein [Nitrococcus mobilis]EAR20226.1 putative dual use protein Tyr:Ser/Thr phosphatase [Nitrococcus mobilis Nb-231]